MPKKQATPDLVYFIKGMWTEFLPKSKEGEKLWREEQEDGVFAVLTMHKRQALYSLRKAGYTVKKAHIKPVSTEEIDSLLQQLGQ